MNVKRFVCCLLASVLLLGVSLISCGNSSRAKAKNEIAQSGEDFKSFLDKFTSSAAFQYTRIKFPLKTPITLLADDGETEKTFPFTKEKWPLLDSETMKEERIEQEEGGIYVSKFTLNEPVHKVFEAGYEESEIDLRVEFEQAADGKWYVVDCYTGWYGYDLPIGELKQTIQQVKRKMQLSKRYILEKAYYSLKILLHNILVLTLFHLPFLCQYII